MLCGPALYCSRPMKPRRVLDDTEGAAHCVAAAAAGLESCQLGAVEKGKGALPPPSTSICDVWWAPRHEPQVLCENRS